MRTHSILRRLGALALAVVMTLSLVTMPALAEENPDTGDTLVEDAAPVTTGGESQPSGEGQPEGESKTDGGEGQPEDEVKPSGEGQPEGESKTDGGETPVETTQATEAPVETTQATEAPTENPEPTETTEAPTEAPTETTEATEAPTETTEVTEPTETTEVTEPTEETTQLTQQELEQVAQVQAMIDALPTTITPDQQEAFVQQYQAVTAAIQALSPAQQELLNLTNYQAAAQAVMALEEDRALDGPVKVGTVIELREALTKGGEIHLTQSITVSDDRFLIGGEKTADGDYLPVENYRDVLLDLGGNTVTCEGKATRAFQIFTGHKVVIQNGTIENMLSTGRCVDLQARANVQLINLTLKTSGEGNSQTVNIGANTDDTVLEIRGCTIDSGTAGYALIAFGRSTISISNSNLSGFAAIYMREEKSDNVTFTSKGSTVTVHNSTLTGKNPHAGPTNEFGVISMQVPVTVTVSGNSTINAIGTGDCPQYVVDAYPGIEPGLKVTIDESTTLNLTPVAGKAQLLDPTLDITKNTVVVPSKYASDLPEDLKLDANNKVVQKITNEERLRAAVEAGGNVVLDGSIALEEKLVIPDGKEVTLDLNGHTISNAKNDPAIQFLIRVNNTKKTTICNGTIRNSYDNIGVCLWTKADTNLFLSGLTLETTGPQINQPLTISSPEIDTAGGVNVTMDGCTIKGGNKCNGVAVMTGATLTMKNSEIVGGDTVYALYVNAPITANIENSKIDGWTALYMRAGSKGSTVKVIDSQLLSTSVHSGSSDGFGTIMAEAAFELDVTGNSKVAAVATDNTSHYLLNVSDGTADMPLFCGEGLDVFFDDSVTLELGGNGGVKLLDPDLDVTKAVVRIPSKHANYLPSDLKLDANNKVVQKITNEERLRAAVNAGGEVVLEGSITLSEPLVIPQGKSVTLNLNGFTLSDAEGALVSGGPDSVIVVNSGASLTVTGNGTIRSSLNGIKMTQDNGYDPNKTASLVMESGTVEAKSAAIIGNGTRHGTSITINGGTLKGDGGAIYHPQQGKVVINGGSLTGGEFGVEMRAGELTVNGGTITATANKFEIQGNGSGSTTQGVAVAVVPYSADRPVTVTINNGKLEGQHALHQEILKDNTGDVTLAVNGGTFTGEVVAKDEEKFISGGSFSKAPAENLAVENWSVTQNPDGSFGVQEDPFIEDEDGKHHVDPSKPLVLDELLEKNKEKDTVSLTISADAQVNKDHVLSGTLLLEAQGHRITGSGSIRTGKKLELKDFGSLKTRVTLPEGGKLVFKDGRVQVLPSERTNDDHEGVGYSVPVIITVGDSTYTYFLSMDPDNAGKIVLDETGKPLVLGQYYSSKGDDAKAPEFTFVYISSHGTYYLGRHTDMTFVSNAPIPSMDYITIDGDPVEGKYLTEPDDEDTASVTLSYRFLRNLDTGKHTIRMYFKDGSRAKAEFSVRKTSVYDPENPKTGDTIFLPLAVMTLSAAALAVLMPRKKKYL